MTPLLAVERVGRRFAGLQALRDVSFTVGGGEALALIGPNGAGKTTLLDIVAGSLRPSEGAVRFRGRVITGLPAHRVARLGIARTFQSLELFPSLTIRENVMAAGVPRAGGSVLAALCAWPAAGRVRRELARAAERHLRAVGLEARADDPAAVLPAGQQRLLAIARALATDAECLLLDEPAAGLAQTDKADLARILGHLADGGRTLLFVEHDMAVVGRLARRLVVLDHGEVIAEGPPDAVREDPRVIEAYLGVPEAGPAPAAAPVPAAAPAGGVGPEPRLLALRDLHVGYGGVRALRGVTLEVRRGEIVALVGANGAGKTTLLRAVSRVVPLAAGSIVLDGRELGGEAPEAVVRAGVSHVPEGRQLFPSLSVWDNLALGHYPRVVTSGNLVADLWRGRGAGATIERVAEEVFALFPVLRERRGQRAGTLSGGEGQMLAIGRALMSRPRLLMLDEPSLGLAPRVIRDIMGRLARLRDQGLTILLVEQNARAALAIADRGYVLETGRVVATGTGRELVADAGLARAYLGLEGANPR